MPNRNVLIAQQDPERFLAISEAIAGAGYRCRRACDAPSALREALSGRYTVVILDVLLPLENGVDLCAAIRRRFEHTPVLFVSPVGEPAVRIRALRAGADDYLTYPCDPEELTLRIEAVLRRSGRQTNPGLQCHVGSCVIDLETGKGHREDERITLTRKELDLLRHLHQHRGEVVSQRVLLRDVWRYASDNTRTVDVHMSMLRQKLENHPSRPHHLVTIRGRGYMLVGEAQPVSATLSAA